MTENKFAESTSFTVHLRYKRSDESFLLFINDNLCLMRKTYFRLDCVSYSLIHRVVLFRVSM